MILAGHFVCIRQVLLLPIVCIREPSWKMLLRGLVSSAAVGIAEPVINSKVRGVEGALLPWVHFCGHILVCMSFGKTGIHSCL